MFQMYCGQAGWSSGGREGKGREGKGREGEGREGRGGERRGEHFEIGCYFPKSWHFSMCMITGLERVMDMKISTAMAKMARSRHQWRWLSASFQVSLIGMLRSWSCLRIHCTQRAPSGNAGAENWETGYQQFCIWLDASVPCTPDQYDNAFQMGCPEFLAYPRTRQRPAQRSWPERPRVRHVHNHPRFTSAPLLTQRWAYGCNATV